MTISQSTSYKQAEMFSDGPAGNSYTNASQRNTHQKTTSSLPQMYDDFWDEIMSGRIAEKIKVASRGRSATSSQDVYNLLKPIFEKENDVEQMIGIYLTRKNEIIAIEQISKGSLSGASVYPREIIKTMLHKKAAAMVISHNHPSGDPAPSAEDNNITKHIVFALHCIGAQMLDHVIVGDNGKYYSFADQGILVQMKTDAQKAFSF